MLASSGGQSVGADGSAQMEDQIRSKLLPHIQNAYALENQLAETLEKHANETADYPDVQAKIQQHLEVTRRHRDIIEERLRAYGESPSTIKDVGSSLMGNMMGMMAGMRPDTVARIARDEYVSEHMEIAGYTLLATTARALGDEETARMAETNMQDEIEMQQWLLQNMPDVCVRSLADEGINVSQAGAPMTR
jgi:ferritin-like metal-binding protein YciE